MTKIRVGSQGTKDIQKSQHPRRIYHFRDTQAQTKQYATGDNANQQIAEGGVPLSVDSINSPLPIR